MSDISTNGPSPSVMARFYPQNLAKSLVLGRLRRLERGVLRIQDGSEVFEFGSPSAERPELSAALRVNDPAFYLSLALGGSVGVGESYALGHWDSESLTDVVRLFAVNKDSLDSLDSAWGRLWAPAQRLYHALRRNTLSGSRHNIRAHYDLGDDFFRSFLDPTMTYSCGLFVEGADDMEAASLKKIERACRKLRLSSRDHLLEIGSGWGALAVYAARTYGCRVTTTTLSDNQFNVTLERVREAGLQEQVTVLKQDYRELQGRFDKIVSVEMIEAVGHQYFGQFFATCQRLLKDDGLMLLQAITIPDQYYAAHVASVDFIKRYIFPGSTIPSLGALQSAYGAHSELRLLHLEDIGLHYARTLREWDKRLHAAEGDLEARGYSREFLRLWHMYFAYCEGGFAERYIGTAQLLLAQPNARHDVPYGVLS